MAGGGRKARKGQRRRQSDEQQMADDGKGEASEHEGEGGRIGCAGAWKRGRKERLKKR
jgi:hypothetical protein